MYNLSDYEKFFGPRRTLTLQITLKLLLPKDLIHLVQFYDVNFILEEKVVKSNTQLINYQNNIYFISIEDLTSSKLTDIRTGKSFVIPHCFLIHDGWFHNTEHDSYEKLSCFDLYGDHYIDSYHQNRKWIINNSVVECPIYGQIIFKRYFKLFTAEYGSRFLWCTDFNDKIVKKKNWQVIELDVNFPCWWNWSIFSDRILILVTFSTDEKKTTLVHFYNLENCFLTSLSPFLSLNLGIQNETKVIVTKEFIFISNDGCKYYEIQFLGFKAAQ